MIDLLPNTTVLYQWVIFMIALMTLHFGIFRPVLKILQERKSKTSGEKERAKTLDQKAEEMMRECEKRMEEARVLGSRQKEERRRIGGKFVEELLKKTRAEIDQKMGEVHQKIEREGREASLQLKQYAQTVSREIATKILEREI
jgi:F-type H+-transporting ATPase subunit b